MEPKGIVPSPVKPKTVVTVPAKKEDDKKTIKLPIDKQQRPDKIPIGLVEKKVPVPKED